jgi:hypothetical protein
MEAMMTKSIVESYGGITNLILITGIAIIVAVIGVFASKKEIKRLKDK